MDDLPRVESAVSATASGNLTYQLWPYDSAMALGMSGRRNPIGFAVVRYLAEGGTMSLWGVLLVLATRLIEAGFAKEVASEAALQAIEHWNHRRCPACNGLGFSGPPHRLVPCLICDSSGDRPNDSGSVAVQAAVSMLIEAEMEMEGQLRARLSNRGVDTGCRVVSRDQ